MIKLDEFKEVIKVQHIKYVIILIVIGHLLHKENVIVVMVVAHVFLEDFVKNFVYVLVRHVKSEEKDVNVKENV